MGGRQVEREKGVLKRVMVALRQQQFAVVLVVGIQNNVVINDVVHKFLFNTHTQILQQSFSYIQKRNLSDFILLSAN